MNIHDEPTEPENEEVIHDYSSTGLCPMCGVELEEEYTEFWVGPVLNNVLEQSCPSCGWRSVPLYDL